MKEYRTGYKGLAKEHWSATGDLILHIPHSSTYIPAEYRGEFLLSDQALGRELANMTDAYTDLLFPCRYDRIVFPVSRLVCDPERFRDDAMEPMSRRGMGAVYTHGSQGLPIRRPGNREAILHRYYDPHHERLTQLCQRALSGYRRCLILDCHSFSPVPLPYEPDQDPCRPDICLGTDATCFHTPPELLNLATDYFKREGFSVAIDRPYAGTLVPMAFYQKDRRVSSLMIEINRGLYLDGNGKPNADFAALCSVMDRLCQKLTGLADGE